MAALAGVTVTLCAELSVVSAEPSVTPPANTNAAVLVFADGSVTTPPTAITTRLAGGDSTVRMHYVFGLPSAAPAERTLERGSLPMATTVWDQDGIRYTQKVFITRVGTNDPAGASLASEDAVLLVQLHGHNTASEYTTARACFEMRLGKRALNLELKSGLIRELGKGETAPLAAVDIAGEGIAVTQGAQLRFQGNMPPGTTGAMTLKIPTRAIAQSSELNQLLDLAFDDEWHRVLKAWKDRRIDRHAPMPVVWGDPPK